MSRDQSRPRLYMRRRERRALELRLLVVSCERAKEIASVSLSVQARLIIDRNREVKLIRDSRKGWGE